MMVKFLIIKVDQPNCYIGQDLEVFEEVKGICYQIKTSNSKILPCSEVVIQKIYLADLYTEVVRIRVLQSINSNTFRCFLIDYGRIEEIRKQKIYNIPLNQLDMDPAVKMIKIPGIKPAGMHDIVHGPQITVHLSESDKWMPSSYKFVSRIFEENPIVHVNYLKHVSKDKMFADVLITYLNRRENLKDLLVAQKYAFISKENELELLETNIEHVNAEAKGTEINGNLKQVENDKCDSESIDSLENQSISIIIENMKPDESNTTVIQSDSVVNTTYPTNNSQIIDNASYNRSLNGTLNELDLQVLNLKVKCWCVSKTKNEEIVDFTYTNPIRPILSFRNEKLIATFIKDAVINYDIKSLLLIQAYTIPSILRGINTVAIAPRRKGKSIGLLLPVLQAISTKQLLPSRSYNPLAIILCSSWKKVKDLANSAEIFIKFIKESQRNRKPRIVAAYNGSTKKMTMMPILQGVDVLIITPNCLLGWLRQFEFFKLNELEMFCLDDAENIIAEHLETLKEILIYKRTGAIDRGCEPGQFITATNWTSGLESFVKYEMGDRFSVAVNDPIEIAVIERIKQKIIEYDDVEGDLYQKLVAYLELTESSIKRTIIFANDDSEIASVYKYLMQKASVDLKLMTGSMSPEELNLMIKEWNQYRGYVNMPILLISDEALHCSDISIFNAQVIIHVDISESSFGARLDFLRDKYKELSFLKSKNHQPTENEKCSSFIFVCSKTINLATADFLYKFLGRCRSDRPPWLQEKAVDYRLNKEKAKGYNEICPRIKSYGECKLPGCNQRHMILMDIDKPLLPNKGYIQFRLLHLESPSHFFVRISEFKNISDLDFPYKSQYLSLKMKMSNYFNNPSNIHGVNLRLVRIGLMAAIKRKDLLERVVIIKMKSKKSGCVLVKLIDVGSEMIVEQADLLNLPRELMEIPHQAIECYVTNIKPLDNDEFYSEESRVFANEFLEKQDLHAIIRLCIGSTLWIDVVTQRIHHTRTQVTVFDKNLSVTLLDKNLIEKNFKHIDKLVRLCTGKIDIWKPNTQENEAKSVPIMRKFTYTNDKPFVFENLPIINDDDNEIETECVLTHIISPNFFFFNNQEKIHLLRNMQNQIKSLTDSIETLSLKDIKIGTRVLFYREENWHRGCIINIDVDIKIFSLDEGLIENFKYGASDLKKLPCEYQDLPYQAILCNLFNCSHSDISYSDDVVAAIKQYTTNTQENAPLIVTAYKEELIDCQIFVDNNDNETFSKLKELDLYQSAKRYSVTISNPAMKIADRMLHNVLIRNQDILPALSWIHEVLPESQPYASRLVRNGSIPHLVADILSTKDSAKRLRSFQTIERIINKKYEKYISVGFIEDGIPSILHALTIIIHFVNIHLEYMCIYRSLNKLLNLAYRNIYSFKNEETNENQKFDINYVTTLLLSYDSFLFHILRHLEISARIGETKDCHFMIDNFRMLLLCAFTVRVLFEETSWYSVMAVCIASLQSDNGLYVLLMDILVQLVMLYKERKELLLAGILNQCCHAFDKSDSQVIWNSSLALISCFVNKQNYSSIFREFKFFEVLFDKFVTFYKKIEDWTEFHDNALDTLSSMWRNGSANFREILKRRKLSTEIEFISKKYPQTTTLCKFVSDIILAESSNLGTNSQNTSVNDKWLCAPEPDSQDYLDGSLVTDKNFRKSYKKIYGSSDSESSSENRTNSDSESDSSDAAVTPYLGHDINPADEDNVLCFEKP